MKIQSNKMARPIIFLVVATGLWLPSLHWVFQRPLAAYRVEAGLSPVAGGLAATYLHVWADPVKREQELAVMRKMNPEWDFMSRTYMVLALANIALREHLELPHQQRPRRRRRAPVCNRAIRRRWYPTLLAAPTRRSPPVEVSVQRQ